LRYVVFSDWYERTFGAHRRDAHPESAAPFRTEVVDTRDAGEASE
jgi:hypothetical protein